MGHHLDMREGLGSEPDESMSSSKKIPGGSHLSGVREGFREVTGSQQIGYRSSVQGIMLLFVTADGLHVKSMTKIELNSCLVAAIRKPVIGVGRFAADCKIGKKWVDSFFEIVEIILEIQTQAFFSRFVQYAQIALFGVYVDPAVEFGVNFSVLHKRSSLVYGVR
jgi:hypothetical protein